MCNLHKKNKNTLDLLCKMRYNKSMRWHRGAKKEKENMNNKEDYLKWVDLHYHATFITEKVVLKN